MTPREQRKQINEDILQAAPSAIDYWAGATQLTDTNGTHVLTFSDGQDPTDPQTYVLTRSDINEAWRQLDQHARSSYNLNAAAAYHNRPSDTDYDYETIDMLVQIAAFNQVIYG
jgi:hypothetical protein